MTSFDSSRTPPLSWQLPEHRPRNVTRRYARSRAHLLPALSEIIPLCSQRQDGNPTWLRLGGAPGCRCPEGQSEQTSPAAPGASRSSQPDQQVKLGSSPSTCGAPLSQVPPTPSRGFDVRRRSSTRTRACARMCLCACSYARRYVCTYVFHG